MSKQKPKAAIAGGKGGNFANPSRSDCQLIQRAVKNGWQIRPEVMEQLPDAMAEIALDEQRDERSRIAAAKVLVTMHGQEEPKQTNILNVHGDFYD